MDVDELERRARQLAYNVAARLAWARAEGADLVQVCGLQDAALAGVTKLLEAYTLVERQGCLWARAGAGEKVASGSSPRERREARYAEETDPIAFRVIGYRAERQEEKAVAAELEIAARKAQIRAEIPDA